MQQVSGLRERKNARRVALVCAALIVLTLVISELKPWSRKPADAGECQNNGPQWRQKALEGKINDSADPAHKSRSFDIQAGSRWDGQDHLWIVPFRTAEQAADTKNFVALIHCTGSVDIRTGDQ
jgi:hypothetical protein